MNDRLPYVANCSLLFTELPLLERPEAARAAGFDSIELWWEFSSATPDDAEIEALVSAVQNAGIRLIGMNFFAGDLRGPDAGVLSIPDRADEFAASVDVAVAIGERLGIRAFNALYGNRIDGVSAAIQDELADEQLITAAQRARSIGAIVMVEPLSGPKPYPLRTAAEAVAVLDRVRARGASNVGLLLDLFHLAANDDDLDAAIDAYADRVAHVQIADFPGRHEPGTGTLDFDHYLAKLRDAGYNGAFALEYVPTTTTQGGLSWLADGRPRP